MGTVHQKPASSGGVNLQVVSSIIMFTMFIFMFLTSQTNRSTFTPKDLAHKTTWDLKAVNITGKEEGSVAEEDSDEALGEVTSRFVTVKCKNLNTTVSLHLLESKPSTKVKREEGDAFLRKIPVVLLHGAAYSSHTWQNLGERSFLVWSCTLKVLYGAGIHSYALDFPGYGESPVEKAIDSAGPADRAEFMLKIFKSLRIKKPAVVVPSMAGFYFIPFLLHHAEHVSTPQPFLQFPGQDVRTQPNRSSNCGMYDSVEVQLNGVVNERSCMLTIP
eukprot:1194563-Prorocentrum_minimum.AAC.5